MKFEDAMRRCGEAHAEYGARLAEVLCFRPIMEKLAGDPDQAHVGVSESDLAEVEARLDALERRITDSVLPAVDDLASASHAAAAKNGERFAAIELTLAEATKALSTRVRLLENRR